MPHCLCLLPLLRLERYLRRRHAWTWNRPIQIGVLNVAIFVSSSWLATTTKTTIRIDAAPNAMTEMKAQTAEVGVQAEIMLEGLGDHVGEMSAAPQPKALAASIRERPMRDHKCEGLGLRAWNWPSRFFLCQ